jgi:hypothetical protein
VHQLNARLVGLGLVACFAAGCDSSPADPGDSEDPGLEATFEQMAAEANSAGDPDAAVAFNDGISALRFGVRPSEIAVHIGDEVVRYRALVVGVVVRNDGTRELTRRSLIAWTNGRPRDVLHATSFSDEAEFVFPSDLTADVRPEGRARGTWLDLARGHRFVATSGPVSMVVDGVGEPCPSVPADARFACLTARWDVRLDGEFTLLSRRDARTADGTALEISTGAEGVHGVVLQRKP